MPKKQKKVKAMHSDDEDDEEEGQLKINSLKTRFISILE